MIAAGCDVGSLTAKAVIIKDNDIVSSKIIRVKATSLQSAETVVTKALAGAGLGMGDVDWCCSTGYGRFDIPFSNMNKSEISCHGLGAFWLDNSIRTIIDIGGQDCKAVSIDENGMVNDFVMNEKCWPTSTFRICSIIPQHYVINYYIYFTHKAPISFSC